MDIYLLQQKLLDAWRTLVMRSDAGSIKKEWNTIPAYVMINNELVVVKDMELIDGKVVLKC